jgi:glucose-1-phosphate thymidylyltransferase
MINRAGIILAGGMGTRLRPLTLTTNKHLIGIYDRQMIFYPLELLRDSFGITDILIVSGGEHVGGFAELLQDGSEYGVNLTYRVQRNAGGIAQALGLAKDFTAGRPVAVVLGDNVFSDFVGMATKYPDPDQAVLFIKEVADPGRFGVPVFDSVGNVIRIEEKPKVPASQFAVTGLYYYPNDVFDVIKTLKPSARGELEITDVNNFYIEKNRAVMAKVQGFWSDAGTPKSLLEASIYVANKKSVDKR